MQWTRKKVLEASERKEEERSQWREQTKELDARKFVFLDESGSNIALTRLYAQAPKGKRARGTLPRNRGKNMTLISSLRHGSNELDTFLLTRGKHCQARLPLFEPCLSLQGLGASLIVDGSANTALFEIYIEQILAPSLEPGQMVIMDNLRIHKGNKVRQLIEARGCQVLFLPAYSPDLSPIEEAFSKIKAILRRIGARTREALQEALEYALTTVSASDASGWFSIVAIGLLNPRLRKAHE